MAGRREAATNWARSVKGQLDTYKGKLEKVEGLNEQTSLAHALQKDGIQNCIDAEDPNSEYEWGCIIGISNLSKKPEYLYIEDYGTTGLTGRDAITKEELERLEKSDEKQFGKEKWARFEASNYGQVDAKKGGARGIGKFIFVGCSKEGKIIYETLLLDGTYRIGEWDTSKPYPLLEETLRGDDAKAYIKENVKGIKSINSVGSRIIILKPKEEIADSFTPFNNSDMESYISATWWQALVADYKITLRVEDDNEDKSLKAPQQYVDLINKPESFPKRYALTNVPINADLFKDCKVEEFRIAYSDEKLPLQLQGISVQRKYQKIQSFNVREGNDFIPQEMREHIFGWIIFNGEAEELLKLDEDTTHYGFRTPKGSLAKEVLGKGGFLEKQIRIYAEKRLGLSPTGKVAADRDKESINVISKLNYIAKNIFKLGGKGTGKKKRKKQRKTNILRVLEQ